MIVRAVRLGWYGEKLREAGEVFVLADEKHFSDSKRPRTKTQRPGWMEKVDPKKQAEKSAEKPKPDEKVSQEVI